MLLGRADDHEVAEPLEQVLDEAARVLAGFDDSVDDPEHPGAVAGGECVDDVAEERVRGVAEQRDRRPVVDAVRGGAGHELVEHGQGVAHRAAAGAHDERQHTLAHRHRLPFAELGQVAGEDLRGDEPERVVVGA